MRDLICDWAFLLSDENEYWGSNLLHHLLRKFCQYFSLVNVFACMHLAAVSFPPYKMDTNLFSIVPFLWLAATFLQENKRIISINYFEH